MTKTTYLSASGSVLSCTTRDEDSFVVLEQILVKSHMLLLGKDRIVCLQVILLEKLLVSVCQRISTMPLWCSILPIRCNTIELQLLALGSSIIGVVTYATAWMSSSGFSKQRSSKLPFAAIVSVFCWMMYGKVDESTVG